MPAAVNVISMTLIQQPGKEKLQILKTKSHSFHKANISYRHISSKLRFFIVRQTRAFKLISKKVPVWRSEYKFRRLR